MKFLIHEFNWGQPHNNAAMLDRVPKPILKWLQYMEVADHVSYVDGNLRRGLHVRLISGVAMFWKLQGHYLMLLHHSSTRHSDKYRKAIRLTTREVESMARVEADRLLVNVDRRTKNDFTRRI